MLRAQKAVKQACEKRFKVMSFNLGLKSSVWELALELFEGLLVDHLRSSRSFLDWKWERKEV